MARQPVKITDGSTKSGAAKVRNTIPDSTDTGIVVRTAGPLTLSTATFISKTDYFKTRSDIFTSTASGVTVNVSSFPTAKYGIQVKGTGGVATSWDIRLEGSLNNVQFSQIVQHTNTAGDGVVVWSGANMSPSLYFRSRVAGLVLTPASDVVVTILGMV